MMAAGGARRSSFADTVVTALLEHDQRPTLVLDISTPSAHPLVVYTNPSFNVLQSVAHPGDASDAFAAFTTRAIESPAGVFRYRGRAWTTWTIQDAWRVVACSIDAKSTVSDEDSAAVGESASVQSSIQPLSHAMPVNESVSHVTPTLVDWTTFDIPGVSAYIQQFRSFDWSQTELGHMRRWPPTLRRHTLDIMNNPDPRLLLWGPDHLIIYNEACIPIIGQKHPYALGRGPKYTFAEMWDGIAPIITSAYHGKSTKVTEMPITLVRDGFEEECFFTFTVQPLCGTQGEVTGVLDSFVECTNLVVAERRLSAVTKLAEVTATAANLDDLWAPILDVFREKVEDIPFALLYSLAFDEHKHDSSSNSDRSDDRSEQYQNPRCVLEGTVGYEDLDADTMNFDLFGDDIENTLKTSFQEAWNTRKPTILRKADGTLPPEFQIGVPGRAAGAASSKAVVIPLPSLTGKNLVGVVVLGLSSRRPYDEEYALFIRLLHDRLTHSIAVLSLPKEQRALQAAAEDAILRHASLANQLLLRTQEAERRESKFSRLYESSPVGMYLLRPDGSPIYVNKAYCNITGITDLDQLSYAGSDAWREPIYPDDIPVVEKFWLALAEQKEPALVEYRLNRPWIAKDENGEKIESTTWLRASAVPDLDDDGEVTTIRGWVSDISLHKWSENLQQKRLEDAIEAKFQSERFIDTVSHEIRNPLSAVLLSADGILTSLEAKMDETGNSSNMTSADVATILESARTIISCTQHQKRIVDDILTFSKLDSNLVVLCPEIIKPSDLIDRAMNMFQAELRAADITALRGEVVAEGSSSTECSIVCDASRVLQVLINLVSNALKFTRGRDRRAITLSIYRSSTPPVASKDGIRYIPRRSSRRETHFAEDWGTGIETFVQFTVVDTGRGLAGDEMEMLFRRFRQANAKTYSQYGGSGLGLFICREIAELHGGQIGVSSTPNQGSTFTFYIKALEHVPQSPAVSFAPSLKRSSLGTSGPETLLVSSTQDAQLTDAATIHIDGLSASISSLPATVAALAEHPAVNVTDLTVLVVEDNLINQKVIATQLRLAGCRVIVASNGLEGINFIQSSVFASDEAFAAQRTSPEDVKQPLSVVLMDLEMPVMDGLTAIRKIREMQATGAFLRHVPVSAVTANARSIQLKEALDAGMDTVIVKPFRISELIPRILSLATEGRPLGERETAQLSAETSI